MQLIDLDNVPAGYQFDEDGVYQPRSINWLEEHYPALVSWTQSFSPILTIKQFDHAGGYLILELLDKIKIKARPPTLNADKPTDHYLALLYGAQSAIFQESLMDVPYTDYGWQKIEARLHLMINDDVVAFEKRTQTRRTTKHPIKVRWFARISVGVRSLTRRLLQR